MRSEYKGGVVDTVEHAELVEAGLDALISRRAAQGDPDAEEAYGSGP